MVSCQFFCILHVHLSLMPSQSSDLLCRSSSRLNSLTQFLLISFLQVDHHKKGTSTSLSGWRTVTFNLKCSNDHN